MTTETLTLESVSQRVDALENLVREVGYGDRIETRDEGDSASATLESVAVRVTALENLADRLGYAVTPAGTPVQVTEPTEEDFAAETPVPVTGQSSTLDYGALAYGLLSIRDKVSRALGNSATSEVTREHMGAVEWFSAIFAAADSSFDADAFRRNAGV